jgi:hypothetical protein
MPRMRCFCIKRVIYINLVDILNSEIAIFSIGDIFITRNDHFFNFQPCYVKMSMLMACEIRLLA